MALERGKLSEVVHVAAGATVGIITVADSKKVYIKSIIMHQSGGTISTARGQVYFVGAGDTFKSENKIFDADVTNGETVMLEPSYPLVLDTTGDKLFVGSENLVGLAATHLNIMITGDKEA